MRPIDASCGRDRPRGTEAGEESAPMTVAEEFPPDRGPDRVGMRGTHVSSFLFSVLALFFLLALIGWRVCHSAVASNGDGVIRAKNESSSAWHFVQNIYLPAAGGKTLTFRCCWRKQILAEALEESERLAVTENPDEEGAYWLVDLDGLSPFKGDRHYDASELVEWAKGSLERRREMAERAGKSTEQRDLGWRIYLFDYTDGGVFPRLIAAEHVCALADLVGKDNVYFAQRSGVEGRHASNTPKPLHHWGRRRDYSNLTGAAECVNGDVRHLDYTVRTDLLEDIADILREQNSSDLAGAPELSTAGQDPIDALTAGVDPVEIDRPHDVVHFWDPEEKTPNAALRTKVSNHILGMGKKYPDLSVFAGLAGQRGKEGRNDPQAAYAQALLQYKIVVVCQRDDHETHYRLMEALISGAMVMTDHVHYFPDGFEDGKNVVVYRSLAELETKILRYLEKDEERKAIARNAWFMALAHHRSWTWLEDFVLGPDAQRRKMRRAVRHEHTTYPLFIGAGQGTTGTHNMHDAMCELGIPSVHYNVACYRKDKADSNVDDMVEMGVNAHYDTMSVWNDMKRCAKSHGCSFMKGALLEEKLRNSIVSVIRSGIGAIHYAPYPFFLSFILSSLSQRRGPVFLITSERDPKEWSVERVTVRPHAVVCKNPLAAFDFPLCVELARMSDPQPKLFADIFTSYSRCETAEERDAFVAFLEDAMGRYQEEVVRLSPVYRANLWEEEMPLNTTTLAAGIWSSVEPELLWGDAMVGRRSLLPFGHALENEVQKKQV